MINDRRAGGSRAALMAIAFGGLMTAFPVLGAEEAGQASKSDAAAFARGARLWAENCNRCHNMRDPKDYRDDQWRAVVAHMRVRAGLTGSQARSILRFLQESN